MTPDIEATIDPSKLPSRLTYRCPSETITITIPEPDAKFHIKLHGKDLKFDPPYLNFAKTRTQTFRVTGTALGIRVMVLIKLGANAPRYQGLPLSKAFSIERAFMQHTFQISFVNHLEVKRKVRRPPSFLFVSEAYFTCCILPSKYMFSTLDAQVRQTFLSAIRECSTTLFHTPPPATRALLAAEAVTFQVLRDALIPPEPVVTSPAAPSPRLNSAAPRFATPTVPTPPVRLGRLGTPTKIPPMTGVAGTLVRSNSFSRMYAAGVGKVELDLVAERDRKGAAAAAAGRRASREDQVAQGLVAGQWIKTGTEIAVVAEQNSLLPLVLSFLSVGASVSFSFLFFVFGALFSGKGECWDNTDGPCSSRSHHIRCRRRARPFNSLLSLPPIEPRKPGPKDTSACTIEQIPPSPFSSLYLHVFLHVSNLPHRIPPRLVPPLPPYALSSSLPSLVPLH